MGPGRTRRDPREVLEEIHRSDAQKVKVAITDNNRVGLTVTNYGFFGNNFTSRSPSFEFPLGTGYEHMVRGGLWVGGLTSFSGTGGGDEPGGHA